MIYYLAKLDTTHLLFHVTIMAFADAAVFVDNMENRLHRLVIGDADRIITPDDAKQFVWRVDSFLLYNLVVANDVEHHFGCNDGKPGYFFVGEELV